MNLTLDRKREYGTIHGEHEFGAIFDQDGFLFDAQGNLIEASLTEAALARLEGLKAQERALEEARATFMKAMPNADPEMVAKLITADNLNTGNAEEEEMDLAGWAVGTKQYIFGKVTSEIRRRFNQSPVNKKQALEILAEHGIISVAPGAATIPSMT